MPNTLDIKWFWLECYKTKINLIWPITTDWGERIRTPRIFWCRCKGREKCTRYFFKCETCQIHNVFESHRHYTFALLLQQSGTKQSATDAPQNRSGEEKTKTGDSATDAVQSIAVRQKLKELETEIGKFRSENTALVKMRAEREEVRNTSVTSWLVYLRSRSVRFSQRWISEQNMERWSRCLLRDFSKKKLNRVLLRATVEVYGSVVTHCAAILSGLIKTLLLVCCVQCGASLAKKKNTFWGIHCG